MTEKETVFGTVLYELDIPDTMAEEAFRLFEENPQLGSVLSSPVIPRKKKYAVIERVFKKPVFSDLMVCFIKKACDNDCIGQIKGIKRVWEDHCLKEAGILKAWLFFVTRPDSRQIEGIQQFLCKQYGGKEVRFVFEERPELLGGFVLKIGHKEYDYSLKGQLKALERAVAG